MKQITELYPADAAAQITRNNRIWTWITVGFALLSLAVCIFLVTKTNTANAGQIQLTVCAISAICGWIVLFLYTHFVSDSKRELDHLHTVQQGERACVTGTVTLDKRRIAIWRSIVVQTVYVQTADRRLRLSINARYARRLPRLPREMTVYTSHGYVVGWEVAECG